MPLFLIFLIAGWVVFVVVITGVYIRQSLQRRPSVENGIMTAFSPQSQISKLRQKLQLPVVMFAVLMGALLFWGIVQVTMKLQWFFSLPAGFIGGSGIGVGLWLSNRRVSKFFWLGGIAGVLAVFFGFFIVYGLIEVVKFNVITSFHDFMRGVYELSFSFSGAIAGCLGCTITSILLTVKGKLNRAEAHYWSAIGYEKRSKALQRTMTTGNRFRGV